MGIRNLLYSGGLALALAIPAYAQDNETKQETPQTEVKINDELAKLVDSLIPEEAYKEIYDLRFDKDEKSIQKYQKIAEDLDAKLDKIENYKDDFNNLTKEQKRKLSDFYLVEGRAYSNIAIRLRNQEEKKIPFYDLAQESAETAIKVDESNHIAHNFLGTIYSGKGMENEAIQKYKDAIKIKEDYAIARQNLGYLLYKKKEYKDAIKHLDIAIELDPPSDPKYLTIAQIYKNRCLKAIEDKNK